MIAAIAFVRGFQDAVMEKLLHVQGHMYVYGHFSARKQMNEILPQLPWAERWFSISSYNGLMSTKHKPTNVTIKSMPFENINYVLRNSWTVKPNYTGDKPQICIGDRLSKNFGIFPGSKVTLWIPNGAMEEIKMQKIEAVVAGVFHIGYYDYDSEYVFLNSNNVQLNTFGINVIYTKSPANIDQYAQNFLQYTDGNLNILTWKNAQESMRKIFDTHALGIGIVIGLFVISGSIQIMNSVWILISERVYDISVLRACAGYTIQQVYQIFILLGLFIISTCIFSGVLLGVGLTYAIPYIRNFIEYFLKRPIIDAQSFWVSEFTASLQIFDIIIIILFTFLLMFISLLWSTYIIRNYSISDGLRYS